MVAPKAHSLGHLIMDLQLQDKVVLVTGGAKAIGVAIIETCAQEGAFTVAVDRHAQASRRLLAELSAQALEAIFVAMEFLPAKNCPALVEQTIAKCDRIDALVNDAGSNDKIGLEQGGSPAFLTSWERNLLHYYKMAHSALRHHKSRGSIVTSFGKRRLRTSPRRTYWWMEVMCSWTAL